MLPKSTQTTFNKDGIFIWENFINQEKALSLRDLVLDMADYENRKGSAYHYPFDPSGLTQRVWNLTNKSKEFRNLLDYDALNDMMNFICQIFFNKTTGFHIIEKHKRFNLLYTFNQIIFKSILQIIIGI